MVARREPPASLPLPAQGLPKHRSCLGWPEQRAADCPNLTMESREKEAPVRHQRSLWLPPPPFLRTPSRLPLFLTSVAPLAQRPHCTPGRRRGGGGTGLRTALQQSGSALCRGRSSRVSAAAQRRRHALYCKIHIHICDNQGPAASPRGPFQKLCPWFHTSLANQNKGGYSWQVAISLLPAPPFPTQP